MRSTAVSKSMKAVRSRTAASPEVLITIDFTTIAPETTRDGDCSRRSGVSGSVEGHSAGTEGSRGVGFEGVEQA